MKRKKDEMSCGHNLVHRDKEQKWITTILSEHSPAPNLFIYGAAESGKTVLMRSVFSPPCCNIAHSIQSRHIQGLISFVTAQFYPRLLIGCVWLMQGIDEWYVIWCE